MDCQVNEKPSFNILELPDTRASLSPMDSQLSHLKVVDVSSERATSGFPDVRSNIKLCQSSISRLSPASEQGKEASQLTLRDKLERFWRNNAPQLLMGALGGAGVGITIGGVVGLMATGGAFSVPLAILGGVVGAPVGALLFVAVPRLLLRAPIASFDQNFKHKPVQPHSVKKALESQENKILSAGVSNAFSRDDLKTEDAKGWQKGVCNWVEDASNFSFWNPTNPNKQSNVLSSIKYHVSKSLTQNLPFTNGEARESGYGRIADYKLYIADVLNQEKGAFLDIGKIVPAPIKKMPQGLLQGFSHIEHLAMDTSCSMATLPSHMLEHLTQLKGLSISGNRYDRDVFEGSSYQSLHSLPVDFFSHTPSLEVLSLEDNDFTSLPDGVFRNLANLKSLDLSGNEKLPLTKELAQGLTNLEELHLSRMQLRELPKEFLENLPNLKRLDLSNNNLADLPADAFNGLDKLEELNIEGNGLKALPANLKNNLPCLRELRVDLNRDPISQVPDGFARLMLSAPGCFPEFDQKYKDSLDVDKLVSYVEAVQGEERVERIKLLHTPGVVEPKEMSLDLSGFKSLTALPPNLSERKLNTLNLSGNESLDYLPEGLRVDLLILDNCGRKRGATAQGSMEKMADDAKRKLAQSQPIGVEARSLLDSNGVLTVYGSIALQEFDWKGSVRERDVKQLDWEKYDPPARLIKNMQVNGSVSIAGRSSLVIPKGVVIRGDLSLKRVNVKGFPDDLEVRGKIYMDQRSFDRLEEIPKYLQDKIVIKDFDAK